ITERCSACGECVVACPYEAITIEEHAEVNEALCKGCGACVGHCLSKAIRLLHYTDEQLVSEMQALLSLEVEAA
ncbi:MAG: 4Fe-4S binding protein, partial [Candidatus Poribacteria bacterium]